jgi:hypothetical protein
VQPVARLVKPSRAASGSALHHASVVAMLFGQRVQYHIVLAMLSHREDQTKIGPFHSHEKGFTRSRAER